MRTRALLLLPLVLIVAITVRARRRTRPARTLRPLEASRRESGQLSELAIHAEKRNRDGTPISDGDAVSNDAMETPDRTARWFADFS